jgi:hypothetical protein
LWASFRKVRFLEPILSPNDLIEPGLILESNAIDVATLCDCIDEHGIPKVKLVTGLLVDARILLHAAYLMMRCLWVPGVQREQVPRIASSMDKPHTEDVNRGLYIRILATIGVRQSAWLFGIARLIASTIEQYSRDLLVGSL